jgi:hypothetical protein
VDPGGSRLVLLAGRGFSFWRTSLRTEGDPRGAWQGLPLFAMVDGGLPLFEGLIRLSPRGSKLDERNGHCGLRGFKERQTYVSRYVRRVIQADPGGSWLVLRAGRGVSFWRTSLRSEDDPRGARQGLPLFAMVDGGLPLFEGPIRLNPSGSKLDWRNGHRGLRGFRERQTYVSRYVGRAIQANPGGSWLVLLAGLGHLLRQGFEDHSRCSTRRSE